MSRSTDPTPAILTKVIVNHVVLMLATFLPGTNFVLDHLRSDAQPSRREGEQAMTERGDGGFDLGDGQRPDPDIPSQAELDAEDMAELAKRSSADRDQDGPVRRGDPGPAPIPLVKHAVGCFWAAAVAGAICMVYGFLNLGTIKDLLYTRLLDGVRDDPGNAAPGGPDLRDLVDVPAGDAGADRGVSGGGGICCWSTPPNTTVAACAMCTCRWSWCT